MDHSFEQRKGNFFSACQMKISFLEIWLISPAFEKEKSFSSFALSSFGIMNSNSNLED